MKCEFKKFSTEAKWNAVEKNGRVDCWKIIFNWYGWAR